MNFNNMKYKYYNIDFDSPFFNKVIQQVLRQVKLPKAEINIAVTNKERSSVIKLDVRDKYKILFDYPEDDDNITGIEIYKLIEE